MGLGGMVLWALHRALQWLEAHSQICGSFAVSSPLKRVNDYLASFGLGCGHSNMD